jgi:hypothetical protein
MNLFNMHFAVLGGISIVEPSMAKPPTPSIPLHLPYLVVLHLISHQGEWPLTVWP